MEVCEKQREKGSLFSQWPQIGDFEEHICKECPRIETLGYPYIIS